MKKEDLIGVAKTGSGKTLAFLIPCFVHIKLAALEDGNAFDNESRAAPWAVVVAPTRELCLQIKAEAVKFGKPAQIRTCIAYGGNQDRREQLAKMQWENPHLVVCTPGRMADYVNNSDVKMDRCAFFVLDEADRLLDMGFELDLRTLIADAKEDRQSLLFSATFPSALKQLAKVFTYRDAIHIQVGTEDPLTGNSDITQSVRFPRDQKEKENLLWETFGKHMDGNRWRV